MAPLLPSVGVNGRASTRFLPCTQTATTSYVPCHYFDPFTPSSHAAHLIKLLERTLANFAPFAAAAQQQHWPGVDLYETAKEGDSSKQGPCTVELLGTRDGRTLESTRRGRRGPTWASDSPASACTSPGPLTVSSTPGLPVRKPAAAAAYPAACSFLQAMNRMPQACTAEASWVTGMPTTP